MTTPIQVMDVGASAIAEVPIYQSLLQAGLAHLNAFEGDDRQIEGIKNAYGDQATIFTDFLFDGSVQTLYLASAPSGMTSLLRPDGDALRFFNGFDQFGHIEGTEQVQTKRLDNVEGLPLIDFLKMDIQGAELTVLKNGVEKLRNCLAVQLEVSYICLYEDQPTFGEVDVWMRSQGYQPHCFLDVKRWSITPTIFNNDFRVPGNQLLESDIVYVKNPMRLDRLDSVQLTKFAALAHHSLRSFDLCVFLLLEMERRQLVQPNAHQRYLESLA
ncbi:MAG: FkbM family methyltransferase [Candidatus Nanopelagicales bacterium]